jgi:predicted DCC family thiol-disulfide oxidoreductase YuxK
VNTIQQVHFREKFAELFGVDLRSLAALRVAMATLIIIDLIRRSRDLVAHYTDFGVLPRTALIEDFNRWRISLHLANGTWEFQALLFVIAGIFAVALLLGYRTRVVTIATWFMLASLHARNPLLLDGGDVLLRVTLFWAIFLPWGACWSIDRALRLGPSDSEAPGPTFSAATFAYVAQIVFVYWFSVLHKVGAEWMQDANALYYTLHFEQFLTPWAQYLRPYPVLLSWLTRAVFWFEVIGPLLLVSPFWTTRLRMTGIIAIVLMHAGIGIFMNIGIFTWVAPLSMLGLLPAEVWNKLADRLRTKERLALRIYYDQECLFCFRTVRLLKTFLLIPETVVEPAQTDPSVESDMRSRNSWVVVDRQGNRHYRFAAIAVLAAHSPFLWPIVAILRWEPIKRAGEWSYKFVANHRRQLGCSLAIPSPSPNEPSVKLGFLLNLLVALLLVYVLVWNVASLPNSPVKLSERAKALGMILRLDQIWNMFASAPKHNSWYVVAGTLKGGEVVDILRNGATVNWEHPDSVPALFPSYRWWKYFFALSNLRDGRSWDQYVSYVCRAWGRSSHGSQTLESVRVVYLAEEILPNSQSGPLQRYLVKEHTCVEKK